MTPTLCVVCGDHMGGVTSIMETFAATAPATLPGRIVLTHAQRGDASVPASPSLPPDRVSRMSHDLPRENVYAVLRRLHRATGEGPGVLVANDFLELAMLWWRPAQWGVVQVVHGNYDFYFDLASRYAPVVDRFLTCNADISTTLAARLPHRASDIVTLDVPVTLPRPAAARSVRHGALRCCYVGRLDESKGVLDVARVADALGDAAEWTVFGDGPAGETMRRAWRNGVVHFRGAMSRADVVHALAEQDVMLLPSYAEGMPVSVLEAAAQGCVPVTSDLGEALRNVVRAAGGDVAPVGDVAAFVRVMQGLAADREALRDRAMRGMHVIRARFDADVAVPRWHQAVADWRTWHRIGTARDPHRGRLPIGSRLDQPWIPNAVVRAVRGFRGPLGGRR